MGRLRAPLPLTFAGARGLGAPTVGGSCYVQTLRHSCGDIWVGGGRKRLRKPPNPSYARATERERNRRTSARSASRSTGVYLLTATFCTPRRFLLREEVAYYTYPAGKLVGTLNATARGLCSDTSGNVFLVNEGGIGEYAHGGTSLINTLGSPPLQLLELFR